MSVTDDLGIGEPREVDQQSSRGQTPRLVATLIGAGLGVGLIIVLGGWFFTSVSQTEAGLCRITWAPCTSLSLTTIEKLSGVELPEGTEVVSAYAQEPPGLSEFRADVVLPTGASSALDAVYEPLAGDWADSVPALADRGLSDVSYWWVPSTDGINTQIAAEGIDGAGRTVILFDSRFVQ